MRAKFKILTAVLSGFAIQFIVLYFFDPISRADTIRYFNFASFFGNPEVAFHGDLAYNKGLLFTPLFLPAYLLFFKKLFGFSYEFSGLILQFLSFQAVIWMSYGIALRAAGRTTAKITLMLLLTNLVLCLRSVFILTDYPFTAVFLCAIFYLFNVKKVGLKSAAILSLLFAILVSMRAQGFVFIAVIAAYLAYEKKAKLKEVLILFAGPVLYELFYICLYLHMNRIFPQTITLNEAFSLRRFFLGSDFFRYNFSLHGVNSLAANYGFFHLLAAIKDGYLTLLLKRLMNLLKFLNGSGLEYNYLFILPLLSSFIYSEVKRKGLLIALILSNFAVTTAILAPNDSFIRYQTAIFPLAVILIASYFTSAYNILKAGNKRLIFSTVFFVIVCYAAYSATQYFVFFNALYTAHGAHIAVPRQITALSSDTIRDAIGEDKKVLTHKSSEYGIIYRSGNTPLYYCAEWKDTELSDYVMAHSAKYLIGDSGAMVKLRNSQTINIHLIGSFLRPSDGNTRLFLCVLYWK